MERLCTASGALSGLFAIGFTFVSLEGQQSLVLPNSVPLKVVQQLLGLLQGQTVQATTETVYISDRSFGRNQLWNHPQVHRASTDTRVDRGADDMEVATQLSLFRTLLENPNTPPEIADPVGQQLLDAAVLVPIPKTPRGSS